MVNTEVFLLGNGLALAGLLVILLLVMTTRKPHNKRKKVKDDIKKIKNQINGK